MTPILNDEVNPMNYPGFLFWQKANVWEKYVNNQLKQFNVTQSEVLQLISLVVLLDKKVEVLQVDLVEFTGVGAMTVSKIFKILEKKTNH
jgi:hypothetical protein